MLKEIVEVATELVEFVNSFEQAGDKRRESIAKYFYRVSENLKEIARQLNTGNLPYGEVAELRDLAEGLPAAIGEEIGKEKAIELSEVLRKSIGENLENLKNNGEAIRLIQESAGKFDGLAFRVGYSDSKPPLIKQVILVALILLALVGITNWLIRSFIPNILSNTTPSPSPSVSTFPIPSTPRRYSPIPFDGRIGEIEFVNTTLYLVRVTLWHPNTGLKQEKDYQFQGGQRDFLSDGDKHIYIGNDWGIQIGDSDIKPVAQVAKWKIDSNGKHYWEVTSETFWK
jgi:hypothetical protein